MRRPADPRSRLRAGQPEHLERGEGAGAPGRLELDRDPALIDQHDTLLRGDCLDVGREPREDRLDAGALERETKDADRARRVREARRVDREARARGVGDERRSTVVGQGDDVTAIRTKSEDLMQAAHKLAEAVYQTVQEQQTAQAAGGDGAPTSDEEVVEEADYEVIDEEAKTES